MKISQIESIIQEPYTSAPMKLARIREIVRRTTPESYESLQRRAQSMERFINTYRMSLPEYWADKAIEGEYE